MTFETDSDRRAMLEDFQPDTEVILNGVPVTIIFDNGYDEVLGSWVTAPMLTAVENDFKDSSVGNVLNINGDNYTIAESPQPDGYGMVTVILQKV